MFKPIPQHDNILATNKCSFKFRTSSTGTAMKTYCSIIDNNTGIHFIDVEGIDEEEAFDKAVKQIGKVARPYSTDEAKTIADKDAEIAALKAQLESTTKKPARDTKPVAV